MLDDPDLVAVLGEEEEHDETTDDEGFKADISALRSEIVSAGFRSGRIPASKSMHECNEIETVSSYEPIAVCILRN